MLDLRWPGASGGNSRVVVGAPLDGGLLVAMVAMAFR